MTIAVPTTSEAQEATAIVEENPRDGISPAGRTDCQCEERTLDNLREGSFSQSVKPAPRISKIRNLILKFFPLRWRGEKAAFTLAEMIIALAVIGVAAMICIPIFYNNADDTVLEKQREVFLYKFNDGLESMKIDDKLSANYSSTEDFVNVMKKYFKIAKICNNDSLEKCFPKEFNFNDSFDYSIIYTNSTTREKNSFESKDSANILFTTVKLKTNADIAKTAGNSAKFNSNVVGIIFSDNIRMLITYNPNCIGATMLEDNEDYTKCFGYIADINANKAPNEVNKDIITNIQLADMGFEIASVGVVGANTHGCVDATQATGDEKGAYTCDYWLGAKRYCENLTEDGGGWSLPNANQLEKITIKIYENAKCSDIGTQLGKIKYSSCDTNLTKGSSMWIFLNGGYSGTGIWENQKQNTNNVYYRAIYRDSSIRHAISKNNTAKVALCVR